MSGPRTTSLKGSSFSVPSLGATNVSSTPRITLGIELLFSSNCCRECSDVTRPIPSHFVLSRLHPLFNFALTPSHLFSFPPPLHWSSFFFPGSAQKPGAYKERIPRVLFSPSSLPLKVHILILPHFRGCDQGSPSPPRYSWRLFDNSFATASNRDFRPPPDPGRPPSGTPPIFPFSAIPLGGLPFLEWAFQQGR